MVSFKTKGFLSKLYYWFPVIVLYISVLNEFDFNYLNIDYFSFNFPFILIFYFALKEYNKFDLFHVGSNKYDGVKEMYINYTHLEDKIKSIVYRRLKIRWVFQNILTQKKQINFSI